MRLVGGAPVAGDGWMIIGDSAGLLNSQRLKAFTWRSRAGMLAAEMAFEAVLKEDYSSAMACHINAS